MMFWLPLFIFFAEMCVVTLCTLRTIFISRGMKALAPLLGFFEVLTWLFAVGEVMKNLGDLRCSLAFAGGFTLGTFLGILIEQTLALGSVVVRTITHKDATRLVEQLRAERFGVTCLDGTGATGRVQVIFTVVPRCELRRVLAILQQFDPDVFYSVDALQSAAAGVAPPRRRLAGLVPLALWPAARLFETLAAAVRPGTASAPSAPACGPVRSPADTRRSMSARSGRREPSRPGRPSPRG
jgi:uncharacterized protein YebE (UPF0316 family)